MKIADFIKISRIVSSNKLQYEYEPPTGVLISRKIYDDLKNDLDICVYYPSNENAQERICGITIFVDDDLPNDFYQFGRAEIFAQILVDKEKKNEAI